MFQGEVRIEAAEDMKEGETRVFALPGERAGEGFLIRHGGAFRAYVNQCCHWPVPLDLGDGDFYYAAIDRITCKTHGATYEPGTGFCDSGPCAGARLRRLRLRAEGKDLLAGPEE